MPEKLTGGTNEYIDLEEGKGHTRIYISTGKVMWNNFLGGLAWGFGTVLGATLVVGILIFVLSQLGNIPFFGNFVNSILDQIQN